MMSVFPKILKSNYLEKYVFSYFIQRILYVVSHSQLVWAFKNINRIEWPVTLWVCGGVGLWAISLLSFGSLANQ